MLSITEQLDEADKALQPLREAFQRMRLGMPSEVDPEGARLHLAYANSRSLLAMAMSGQSVGEVMQALEMAGNLDVSALERQVAAAEPLTPPADQSAASSAPAPGLFIPSQPSRTGPDAAADTN